MGLHREPTAVTNDIPILEGVLGVVGFWSCGLFLKGYIPNIFFEELRREGELNTFMRGVDLGFFNVSAYGTYRDTQRFGVRVHCERDRFLSG